MPTQDKIYFDTYAEAYYYFSQNYLKVPEGHAMGISYSSPHYVHIRPIYKGDETYKMPSTWNRSMVIQDGMDPVVNHVDGKTYDSREKYYKSLKASGNHVMEKGENYHVPDVTADKNYVRDLKQEVANVAKQVLRR